MSTSTGPGERAAPHAWDAGPRYAVGRRRKWGPAPSVSHIISHPATWLDNAWFAVCGDLLRNPMSFTPQPALPVCRNCADRAGGVRRDRPATR
jgi:hypothetical protein